MLLVSVGVLVARATTTTTNTYTLLPHITHLTAKPSRMIGVQVGVWWCRRAQPSLPPEHLIMYLGKETSTLGITGLTFLRIASP